MLRWHYSRMSPIPHIARVPLTTKQPDACPFCDSHNLTRRGTRKKKLEIVQLWRCASCKHTFTPGPAALHNKTYPLRTILGALTGYNLGYSLDETAAARLKKKTHGAVSPFSKQAQRLCARMTARDPKRTA
jgi:ribosomal protein L37AE/L43A